MSNAANVRVGVTGAVYIGETSATAPASATDSLTGFTALGFVTTDGVTEQREKSTNQIRAWQNAELIREQVTESTATFEFTLLETSPAVLAAYYGAVVDTTDGSVEVDTAATGGRKSFVIDLIDGDQQIRTYIPLAEILSTSEQVYQNGEPVGYGVTVTAYASPEGYSYKKFYSALVE